MIHAEFWNLTSNERVSWLGSAIQTKSPARPQNLTKQLRSRQDTRVYTLSSLNCESITLCKTFFLSMLGLNSDQMIKTALAKMKGNFIRSVPDKRGRHEPIHKLSDSVVACIKNHIMSFGPSINHYRREHAPNRFYLSPEFTIKSMFDDFRRDESNLLITLHIIVYFTE